MFSGIVHFADRSNHVTLFLSVCLWFWHANYLKWIKVSWLSFIWRGLVSDAQKLQNLGISPPMVGLGIWSVTTLFTLLYIRKKYDIPDTVVYHYNPLFFHTLHSDLVDHLRPPSCLDNSQTMNEKSYINCQAHHWIYFYPDIVTMAIYFKWVIFAVITVKSSIYTLKR